VVHTRRRKPQLRRCAKGSAGAGGGFWTQRAIEVSPATSAAKRPTILQGASVVLHPRAPRQGFSPGVRYQHGARHARTARASATGRAEGRSNQIRRQSARRNNRGIKAIVAFAPAASQSHRSCRIPKFKKRDARESCMNVRDGSGAAKKKEYAPKQRIIYGSTRTAIPRRPGPGGGSGRALRSAVGRRSRKKRSSRWVEVKRAALSVAPPPVPIEGGARQPARRRGHWRLGVIEGAGRVGEQRGNRWPHRLAA